MAERSQSAAYATLTPCARKVLAVIEGKIAAGGGVATVSLIDLATLSGVLDSTAFLAQKQAVLLGFVNSSRDRAPVTPTSLPMAGVILMRTRPCGCGSGRAGRCRRQRSRLTWHDEATSAVDTEDAVGRCAVADRHLIRTALHAGDLVSLSNDHENNRVRRSSACRLDDGRPCTVARAATSGRQASGVPDRQCGRILAQADRNEGQPQGCD